MNSIQTLGLAGLVGLYGCSCEEISRYDLEHPLRVLDTIHEPARTYRVEDTYFIFLPMGDGTLMPIPMYDTRTVYDDEDFILRLIGKERPYTVYVSQDVFLGIKKGDHCDLRKIQYSLRD